MVAKKTLAPEIEALNDVLTALERLADADKSWVLQTASARLGGGITPSGAVPTAGGPAGAPLGRGRGASGIAPKDFMRQKNPGNDVQRAACLAYYLTHHRSTPHFKSRDLSNLNTEAAGPRVNMSRAVNNATNQSRYLASAGGGKKQITSHGEDVVEALPGAGAAQAAESRQAKTKKARRKKSPRKKKGS